MVVLTSSVNVSRHVHLKNKYLLVQYLFNKLTKKTLKSVFFVIGFSFSQFSFALPPSCPKLASLDQSKIKSAIVDWLPDGDTIHTKNAEKLRLLNINTPEINASKKHKNKPSEPFAKAAKEALSQLIGKSNKIYWVTDVKSKDKYGRELALVFNESGVFLNAQLVLEGLAHSLVIPPNQLYWHCIRVAQTIARKANKGIWSVPFFQPKSVKQIKENSGPQLVSGKITEIINSKKYRWLVLDEVLWVGIKRQDFKYFAKDDLNYKVADEIILRGYPYQSHGKLRMKLQHPAMLLQK